MKITVNNDKYFYARQSNVYSNRTTSRSSSTALKVSGKFAVELKYSAYLTLV